MPAAPEPKSHRNILSALKKSLSPGTKSSSKSPKSPNSAKPKSRSPLASLLRSPSKRSKLTRMNSCVSPDVPLSDGRKMTRSKSVPCEPSLRGRALSDRDRQILLKYKSTSIDATCSDNCVITRTAHSPRKRLNMEVTARPSHVDYSPSNFTQTVGKPEKDKRLESPFHKKQWRKSSSKNLFKRLLGSTPPASPEDNNAGAITIGYRQTASLSKRSPTDCVSQLSVDIPSPILRSSSAPDCNYCNSNTSISAPSSLTGTSSPSVCASSAGTSAGTRVVESKEMAAIEAGRKVFDVTSPDNCQVVEIDSSEAPLLERTICYEVRRIGNFSHSML